MEIFGIGFTRRDLIRAVWTFVFAALGFVIAVQADIIGGTVDWRAVGLGALAAGLSAVKNLVLQDGSLIKG